ncbi:hypothetical protein EXIGLDRAFT_753385 [Exidia glandulosa HHB12029]|uniref:Uncharacterized protein n=1 Tax=Exidia glandulosa HHB12029 TaxID=1314781 RepID=A0A165DTQ6_EXIGL|nr:hypothetical protein EXIGLDRAFT_753385 [Exidia glandulosa HHB12029]
MRFAASLLFLLITAASSVVASPFLDSVVSDSSQDAHILGKRASCNGIDMRTAKPRDCWRINGLVLKGQLHQVAAYQYDMTKAKTTAHTNPATDYQVHPTNPALAGSQSKATALYTCDHIMELQILQAVLDDEGICKAAAAMADQADAKAKLYAIRAVANSDQNLVYFQKEIESVKGTATEKFSLQKGILTGKPKATTTDLEWLAMEDYLTKTASISHAIAKKLDDEIEAQFGVKGTHVADKWNKYMAAVKLIAVKAKSDLNSDVKHLKQQAAAPQNQPGNCGGSTTPPGSPTGSTHSARRMIPLLTRSARPLSSLEKRAAGAKVPRGAARSGPHAPPAPSCPLPGAKQKKVVPRNKIKTKPAPAKKPRVPAKRPAPRKPAKPKKVVPRPANRPRRVPGKQAPPRKRTTPKKKPRKVPKPATKSKGKSRGRRR